MIYEPQTAEDERHLSEQLLMVRILRTIEQEESRSPRSFIRMEHLVEWVGESMATTLVDAYKKMSDEQIFRDTLFDIVKDYDDLEWDYVAYVISSGGWLFLRALAKNDMEWLDRIPAAVVEQYCKEKGRQPSAPYIMPEFARTILEKYVAILLDRIHEAVGKGLYLATIEAIMGGFPTVSMMIGLSKHFKKDLQSHVGTNESTEFNGMEDGLQQ